MKTISAKLFPPLASLLFIIGLLGGSTVQAQLTVGHITGHVQDSSGAVIAGARVTLTNEGTGVAANVISTETGTYTFELVNPGTYTLRVEASGFSPQITKGVQVHVQESVTQDYTLSVGDITQQVTIVSAALFCRPSLHR